MSQVIEIRYRGEGFIYLKVNTYTPGLLMAWQQTRYWPLLRPKYSSLNARRVDQLTQPEFQKSRVRRWTFPIQQVCQQTRHNPQLGPAGSCPSKCRHYAPLWSRYHEETGEYHRQKYCCLEMKWTNKYGIFERKIATVSCAVSLTVNNADCE